MAVFVKRDTHYVFAKGIKNKRALTVKEAAVDMGIDLKTVWRFHSDQGSEFAGALREWLREFGVHYTDTGGYNPQSNALAENIVGEVIG